MSSNLIPQDRTITNQDGSTQRPPNRTSCVNLLQGMLASHNDPTIHYLYNEEQVGNQIKHVYKFYVIVRNRIINVSGIISMIFGVIVQDRSQAFSLNTLPKNEDVKAFSEALRKNIGLESLALEDLVQSAEQPMDYVISPAVIEFMLQEGKIGIRQP